MAERDNTARLYEALKGEGYTDLGTLSEFEGSLKDSGEREHVYTVLSENGYSDLGDFKQFETKLGYGEDTDNFFGDFGERLAAGAGRLVGSSTNLLKKITTPVESAVDWANEHTKGAAGVAAQSLAGTIPGLGMIAHIPDKNAGLERLSKNAEAFAEDMHERSDRYKGKSFSDLWSEGDYQGAFGSAFLDAAESAATSAAIAATGGAGLVAAGLTTASDKYDELSRENPEMGETLKWANAIGTGAAESLSEVFGAGMMGRTVRNILQKSGREAAANLVKKNFLDKIASFEGKHWFAMPIASEGLEEAGNALAGYAIDRLTGVERNDNIFKTMLDAGVAGSMGGAQFSPFIGAAKGYSAYQKRQITNRYKESSTFAGEILHEDVEKFNDAIVNRLKNPKSIQSFIDNVASVKNLNPEEKRKLEQYTVDLLNYNGYVDYVQSRIDEETRRRMDDIGRTANKDMGQVVTVKFPSSDQPVYITGGNIVFDEEGLVDAKQSDDILYYLDENGKVQQGRPEMFDSLIEQYPVEQLYADIINTVPGEVIAQEEKESEAADMQPVMFNPGDLVNLVDGRQGIVQQMSDDGGVIVEVDGMTEEIGVDSIIDNMSKNQTPNEDSSTDGDSRVLENVPEKTLESVVASLPKRNDGTIDYKAMTPQQQYEYTSLSESPQTALEDLRADIENKRSEISKSESRIEKASGGERASLRDEIRVKKQELADLEAFYQTVTPDVDSSAEENVILPASQTEIPINQESNTPESSIPMDEAGNPIYHQAEISDTLDALLDGSLTLEEVDQFVNNHISDAERRLTESGKKAPMMELDIDGYKARKKEWEEGRKPIEQEKSYWEDIKSKLQDARVKPGEEAAINLMRNTAPQSGEELAAQMLANGSIKLLQDDYRRETGGRISESRSLFGLFAGKDKGGVSIERAGEILMQADLENGTNFFDQKDPNAGRNAIIEVLSTARTRGDLINYIKNRREAKAEEMRQAEYNEYARWCEENYHLSPEDYEAYEDAVVRDFKEKMLTDEEQFELDSQMADEIRAIQEELKEIDAILAQNRTEKDENTEGNDESGGDVLREGGSEILQGEQSAQTGRSGEIEAGEPAGPGVDRANGVAQESVPGEIKPIGKGVFGDIYDQFRGKAKEAIKFLLRKRSGEAIGALHHKEVGDIDLVWGKEGTGKSNGFGLSKLAKFHPEVLDSLQDILDDMVVISRSANRVNLESKTHKAAVRLEWDGEKKNWLLTAFEKEKPTATDRTTDIGDTELQNDTAPLQTESSSTDKDSDSSRNINDLSEKIADAEANTDINPTEAQKEAGNYKKGHVRVGTFDISIEQPKGSVRSGVDANGKKWETTMQNTYGYIRGTEGVDGDHIDVFLSDDIDGWNGRKAFVVDQYNEDGSFDEHKVMLGFNEAADAETAYFANYDKDWAKKHKTVVTPVNLEDFEKWIGSSHRKTKAFAEYKSVKTEDVPQKVESSVSGNGYTIEPAQYTTKRGKVLDMHLVKFQSELRKEVQKHTAMFAKEMKGWWDREKRGFMMRSEEDARRLVDYATDAQSQPPLSLSDLSKVNDGDVQFAESPQAKIQKQEEKQEYTPVWQYSVSVDKETGYTTLKRDDVSDSIPIGDGRFNYTANSPEEMLEIVRNPKNFDQELRDAVETILENKVKIREIARAEKAKTVKQEPKSENNPSGNRLVTDERYAELRERMRKKLLGQMNIGIDPEILTIGTEMAVYHLEKGSRKFTEYATAMIADLGDAIRPYLKAFYNGARDLPEVLENGLNKEAKKQFEEYAELMKKELQEKEAKYAEMDKTVETATDIVNIGEEDEAQSHINRKDDKNVRFRSASDSLMETSSKFSQVAAIDELASSLHIPIHIIRDINDITDEDKDTQRKKRGSKGWYDMETGEVYLVLPNAENIADAQATVLHEVVAHKGLRGLLGEKFDDMMDSVYRNLPEDVRRKVTCAGLSRYGGDFRIATEEYLASVAENGVSEPSIWQKIKSAIRGFFRSLGIDLRMRDEDIAYMLWKSKNRLEKGDSLVTIIHKVAKDGNMRDTLLFRDPLVHGGTILNTPSEDRRTMIRTIGAVSEGARSFSAMTREFYKRFREGYQDQKIHIRDFQKAVEKETGHKVKDYEDAYIYENTTQGRAEYDVNHFKANEFAALVNEVARLSRDGKNIDKDKRRKVDLYMKAKHGLERNEVMRREALASVEQPSPELIESIGNKDFAGLTAITKALSAETKGMDEDIVRRFVEEFEKENDTKKLWEAVGKATRATLEKMYQCNLISRESRDRISGKYEYYVPLKEWEETTAGDIWDYIDSNRDIVSNPIKKAKGRTSMAGDILANIASDYESATMMGYKNLVKLRFANLVRNSKTGMASVSRQWYVKSGVDTEGRTLWEPVSATGLTEDAETNASIINDFEEKMKELQEKGEAKTQQEVLNLGVPIKDWQEQQHVVRVKEGGRDLLVYINGNPVVSQAVNGINRASLDNVVLKGLNNVRKFMMQNYTSRNINFILRNFARDFFYANTMNFVKYGAAYEGRFLKNYPLALWRIAKVEIGGRTDLEYEAFLRGGGKTGYVATFGYDKYKKEVERLLNRNAGGRVRVKDVFNVLGGYFEMVNGVVENGGRFTTYLTAKESGMTELQSINAAKEVSVNFNRRGSGAMGAVYMQNFFHFFNAAIQGTHNFAHAAKHNPVRAGAAIAMWATLGFAVSTLSKMLFGDDDEYNDIPDYVRQNNLILPMGAPGKYVLLPLPVELRMLFGLGDMSAQYTRGEYKGRDFTSDVMGKLMDVLPLSIESNATDNLVEAATRTFTPDMISPITEAYLFNENYFGKRITGRNEFNKYVPEYHKVTTGTSKAIIKASERLNSLSGGDYASKGKLDYALLNPSAVEYLFEQYLGGVGKAIAQCYKTVEGAVTGDVQLRNIPVVSGLTYDTENMVPRNYTNECYNHYVKEYEEMQSRDRMYRKGLEGGKDLSGNYKSFANSRAYRRYQTTGFYKKAIESMYDMARLMDGEEKKALYEQARKTKEMMINELDKIGDE